ncbi:hypothetical protein C1645_828818 [Glomus cerebriforme]|uniref:Serine-threonine/tyrosine-protein kinase catalytic domain-containing protein n=1 Tax=Glomus cerebriforme TaxID=658196 RepID=A0A397SPA5_9GLOM|nr:hypothetical protein C1645_828818 [Glomus cerebriforme]
MRTPYVAPEVFQGQKYIKASDIYGFDLIIEICDGLRPPIVTNAPEGYIELMKKCWHSDPNEKLIASPELQDKI